jgi:hypothetical protein
MDLDLDALFATAVSEPPETAVPARASEPGAVSGLRNNETFAPFLFADSDSEL